MMHNLWTRPAGSWEFFGNIEMGGAGVLARRAPLEIKDLCTVGCQNGGRGGRHILLTLIRKLIYLESLGTLREERPG